MDLALMYGGDRFDEYLEKIRQSLHLFDPISLLRVLQYAGVPLDEINFRSHFSFASQSRLVESIDLINEALTLTFNVGLLSSQSPLPSYFFREIDEGLIELESFQDFINLFDHTLIKHYLQSIYPELNHYLFPNWSRSVRRRIRLQNMRTVAGVHWLFQRVYPDLMLDVSKQGQERRIEIDGLKLGAFQLGDDAIFGRQVGRDVLGIRASIYVDEEFDGTGTPWFKTIRNRFEQLVVPILSSVGVDLELVLVFSDRTMDLGFNETSFLGYDRIAGGDESDHRVVLFRGQLCS